MLGETYAEQVLAMRHGQSPKLATLLAGAAPGPLKPPQEKAFWRPSTPPRCPIVWSRIEANTGKFDWAGTRPPDSMVPASTSSAC